MFFWYGVFDFLHTMMKKLFTTVVTPMEKFQLVKDLRRGA